MPSATTGKTKKALKPKLQRQELFAQFRARILNGRWPAGSMLPTQRQLAAEYGLSEATAWLLLNRLQAEGLVTRTPGRGTVVREHGLWNKTLAVVRAGGSVGLAQKAEPRYQIDRFSGICEELGYQAVWHHLPYETLMQPALLIERFLNVKAVLGFQVPGVFFDALLAEGIPTVAALRRKDEGADVKPYPQFDFDRRKIMRVAVDHLVGLGHRRIAYVARALTSEHAAGFIEAVQHHDLALPMNWLMGGKDYYLRDMRPRLSALLSAPDRPSAICCETEHYAYIVENFALDLGLKIPRDLAIVAGDVGDQAIFASVPLTTVSFDVDIACRQILGVVDQITSDVSRRTRQRHKVTMLPLRLAVRQSCGGTPTDSTPLMAAADAALDGRPDDTDLIATRETR